MKRHAFTRIASLALAFFLALGLLPAAQQSQAAQFSDIASHWAKADIQRWNDDGIINGYTDGTFRPESKITRAQFASMLQRYMKFPAAKASFNDVNNDSDWFAPEIGALQAAGIMRGSGGKVRPNDTITREEAAALLARALELDTSGTPSFADNAKISSSSDFRGAAAAMQQNGYITGKPGNLFDPKGELKRCEMAVILSRIADSRALDSDEMPLPGDFVLAAEDSAVDLYIDSADWEGAAIALDSLKDDIKRVGPSVKTPEIKNELSTLSDSAVIVGTIGKSTAIDKLTADGKLDVSDVKGKWESFIIAVVDEPFDGVDKALVVAGSDKRGTIYGIYKISELIGVSPWVWWADSTPVRKAAVWVRGEDTKITQGEPSVQYRGIFLNDEAPSLSSYVSKHYGNTANPQATNGYVSEFYTKVFELILRLKGNYLWPAMWNNAFFTDDPQNGILADKYGIVMGTSHHEPMNRADKEWNWYSERGNGQWNYYTNSDALYDFWKESVSQRKDLETIITIGMRGQNDTSMLPDGSTVAENVALLNDIISDQREIIKDAYGSADGNPQLWALYKEVEDYYYGDGMVVPDDVTLLLCDDNFGNVRTLPTEANRDHPGGFGMYYHFDYNGGPISYMWINQTPLTKVWEQMSMAYDAGVQKIWIVNVGDLKPMELPIDYFLNLAYDYDTWGEENKVGEFTRDWAAREFGEEFADDSAFVLNEYTKINGARKAEVVLSNPSTFSLTSFDEADTILRKYEAVVEKAESVYATLPSSKKDAFYQLVLYPARASMNVYKTNIYAAWNNTLAAQGLPVANTYGVLSTEAFDKDREDMDYYNNTLSGGKWNGMMSQNHIGYTTWNSYNNADTVPALKMVKVAAGQELVLRVQGSADFLRDGSASLPSFTDITDEQRYIDIFNGKDTAFTYTISADKSWIVLEKTDGVCLEQERVGISVNWSALTDTEDTGTITVSGAGKSITLSVTARSFDTSELEATTFVETDGYVSINPSHYAAKSTGDAQWTVIDDYGRDGDSVKVLPNGKYYSSTDNAPYIDYKFYLQTPGSYNVNVYLAPTTNARHESLTPQNEQLRYTVQIDSGTAATGKGLVIDNFKPGDYSDAWTFGCVGNTRMISTSHGELADGVHTLRVYAVDPGVVIQKIVIAPASETQQKLTGSPQTYHFMDSYFGPPESYYTGMDKVIRAYPALDAGIKHFVAAGALVTFEVGTGSFAGDIKPKQVTASAANNNKLTAAQISAVGTPTRDGYEFKGWKLPNGIIISADTIFVESATVTAYFISLTPAAIKYDANGGSGDAYEEIYSQGEEYIVMDNAFTYPDRFFSHWNTKADGSGSSYSPGAVSTAAGDTVFYAIWADKQPAIVASSDTVTSRAANAIDGNADTAWTAIGTKNEWLELTLNGEYSFDSLYVDEKGGNIQEFEISYWDGSDWVRVLKGEAIGANQTLLFENAIIVKASKLRLNIISADNVPAINEISVTPFINWALKENGGVASMVDDEGTVVGIEGSTDPVINGDRTLAGGRDRSNNYDKSINVTVLFGEMRSISAVNFFSQRSDETVPLTRELTSTLTLNGISVFEYTTDGGVTWTELPGGEFIDNTLVWLRVELDTPIEMNGIRCHRPFQPSSVDDWTRALEFEALEYISNAISN